MFILASSKKGQFSNFKNMEKVPKSFGLSDLKLVPYFKLGTIVIDDNNEYLMHTSR
jgi:hypothetical protein